jgi:LSD1 subclass zinc finger protein
MVAAPGRQANCELMTRKIWVQPGWLPIVDEAVLQLSRIGIDVLEVREKLGELRIHVAAGNVKRPDVQATIGLAKERAANTCDICGRAGRLRLPPGARRVRCDEHVDQELD